MDFAVLCQTNMRGGCKLFCAQIRLLIFGMAESDEFSWYKTTESSLHTYFPVIHGPRIFAASHFVLNVVVWELFMQIGED